MNEATVAEVARRPSGVLSSKASTIVTNNGHAQNVIVNVAGLGLDDAVDIARTMQGLVALAALQKEARENGASVLSDEEIEAEISAVRSGR